MLGMVIQKLGMAIQTSVINVCDYDSNISDCISNISDRDSDCSDSDSNDSDSRGVMIPIPIPGFTRKKNGRDQRQFLLKFLKFLSAFLLLLSGSGFVFNPQMRSLDSES